MFRRCEILQLHKIEAKTKRLNVLFLVRTLRLQNDSRLTKMTDSNIYSNSSMQRLACPCQRTALMLMNEPSLLDPFEAIELLETLEGLGRTQAHGKADEYAAALEEVKTRQPTLDSTYLQRLMLGLVEDPLRAKMAKEATSPSGFQALRPLYRSTPYSVQCYACAGWRHIARNCNSGRGRGRRIQWVTTGVIVV